MEKITRSEIVAKLIANGNDITSSNIFADTYLEYREAMENIKQNGIICADPRSGAPMKNPYAFIRDRASDQLLKMRHLNLDGFDWGF